MKKNIEAGNPNILQLADKLLLLITHSMWKIQKFASLT